MIGLGLGITNRKGGGYPSILDDGNTVLWVDYTKGITKDASDLVSQWSDQSGNNNHLLQATGSKQPKLTSDGVLFNGVSDFLKTEEFLLRRPTQVYILLKQITWTGGTYITDGFNQNSFVITQNSLESSPHLRLYAGASSASNPNLALDTYGVLRILLQTNTGGDSSFQIDESTKITGNFGYSIMDGLSLGGNASGTSNANIEVKEIIIRTIEDTAENEEDIYEYLKKKIAFWIEMTYDGITYDTYTEDGVTIRQGIRDGFLVRDITLTELGFDGVEDVDWENILSDSVS